MSEVMDRHDVAMARAGPPAGRLEERSPGRQRAAVARLEHGDLDVDGNPHQGTRELEGIFGGRVRPDRVDGPEVDDQQGAPGSGNSGQ